MNRNRFLVFMSLTMMVAVLGWGFDLAHAGAGFGTNAAGTGTVQTYYANSPAGNWTDWQGVTHASGGLAPTLDSAGNPLPGGMRKFVDLLPNLCGPAGTIIPTISGGNGTAIAGACIPVANPQPSPVGTEGATVDYYEIAVVEYSQPMHADLPKATKLQGYVQVNDPGNPVKNFDGSVNLTAAKAITRYLGPVIVATKGKPVRIKYTNLLPPDTTLTPTAGNLFIPVDHTLMGAGLGPDNVNNYSENRIAIHLHGGHTAWVSDGTPHQWTVPVGEVNLVPGTTTYMRGASFQNVPDMTDPSQGSGTLYYTNDQPSRLMFYHDHAVGITRLNVYVGIAAGYLLQDPPTTGEWTLPGVSGMPQIPLVIQDKTFVPADVVNGGNTGQDQKWDTTHWGQYGDLWFPHVYETNQDPINSPDGTNPVGRWDWGPWFWPVFPTQFPLPTGAYGDVTTTPEAFMDTPVVNGIAYPTLTVDPTAIRFRILNAANDRMFNLGLYVADPLTVAVTNGGAGYPQPVPPALGPPVTFSYGGAKAYATVSTGSVTAIPMSNAGQGYVTPPPITIAPRKSRDWDSRCYGSKESPAYAERSDGHAAKRDQPRDWCDDRLPRWPTGDSCQQH